MLKIMSFSVLGIIMLSLTFYSCSATYRHYDGPKLPEKEVAEIKIQDRAVRLVRINGDEVDTKNQSTENLHLLPGKYKIVFLGAALTRNIRAYSVSNLTDSRRRGNNLKKPEIQMKDYLGRGSIYYKIEFTVEPGRKYWLCVNSKYSDKGYAILDVTDESEKLLAESDRLSTSK